MDEANQGDHYSVEQLKAVGGSVWEERRVYFNDLLEFAEGVEVGFYKTGNVSSAAVDGVGISNTQARTIVGKLRLMKFWYDLESKKFMVKNGDPDLATRVRRGIEKKIRQNKKATPI